MESKPPRPPVVPTFIWPQAMVVIYLEAKGLEMASQFHRAERGQYAGTENEYTLWDKDMRITKEKYSALSPVEILQKVMRHSGRRAYGKQLI
jgi:hypothetical protein